MTPSDTARPVLACFDRSEDSREALKQARELISAREVVVLTVWQTVAGQLATGGIFRSDVALPDEEEVDLRERAAATDAAEDGAESARSHGLSATARVEQAGLSVWQTIVAVADELDASLIICGATGRGALSRALLGSTSDRLVRHAGRPVLVVPTGERKG